MAINWYEGIGRDVSLYNKVVGQDILTNQLEKFKEAEEASKSEYLQPVDKVNLSPDALSLQQPDKVPEVNNGDEVTPKPSASINIYAWS